MSNHLFINHLRVLALLLFAMAPSAALADTGSFERTISLDDAVVLDVSTGSGDITIRVGGDGEAVVRGKVKAKRNGIFGNLKDASKHIEYVESNPPVELDGERLVVGRIDDRSVRKAVSISYEITVPAGTEVVSKTGSGDVTVTGIAGKLKATSGSGDLELRDIGASVEARTGSGDIDAFGVAGSFDARSGSGDIHLRQTAPGDVHVSTGSGDNTLEGIIGGLHAASGSGRIRVDGQMTDDWTLDTGSGGVRVTLPSDAAFDVDAESNSGGVHVDHPVTIQGRVSKKHIRGEVRGGGPLLKIETGSGGIRISSDAG